MSAHTPGPWTARFKETQAYSGSPQSGTCSIENERHTRIVAHVVTAEQEDCANARLIAAAPDLLAACKLALGAFERHDAIDWSELERAIQKAEGVSR